MIEEEIKADFYGHENEKFVTHTDWREIAQDFFDSNDDEELEITAYNSVQVKPYRHTEHILDYILETFDEEYSRSSDDYSEATEDMREAVEECLEKIANLYVPSDVVLVGRFKVRRENVKEEQE